MEGMNTSSLRAGSRLDLSLRKKNLSHTQMWDLNGMRCKLSDVHGRCVGCWYEDGQYFITL